MYVKCRMLTQIQKSIVGLTNQIFLNIQNLSQILWIQKIMILLELLQLIMKVISLLEHLQMVPNLKYLGK